MATTDKKPKPILSEREHRAYQAAYQILNESTRPSDLATPGGRRSEQIDRIARIIQEAFA